MQLAGTLAVLATRRQAGVRVQEMKRLLFVFSKLNPGLQYVQGMNELVAPLFMVFKTDAASEEAAAGAEADCFFCFVKLLTVSEVRDLYCKTLDGSSTGVKAVLGQYAPFSALRVQFPSALRVQFPQFPSL